MLDSFRCFCRIQTRWREWRPNHVPYYPFTCMQVRGQVWLLQLNKW